MESSLDSDHKNAFTKAILFGCHIDATQAMVEALNFESATKNTKKSKPLITDSKFNSIYNRVASM